MDEAQHACVAGLVICELAAAGELYEAAAWLCDGLGKAVNGSQQGVIVIVI
jgi:hypothetical protein